MSRKRIMLSIFAALLVAMVPLMAMAEEETLPGQVLVSIYHVAPGKHLDFLKWMAAQEAVAKEAGVDSGKWYAHANGDSWDYVVIGSITTDEQDSKIEELSKKKGLATGFKASLEFRQYMASHSDTYAIGPTSATALVEAAEK